MRKTARSVASLAARSQHPTATREAHGKPAGAVVRFPATVRPRAYKAVRRRFAEAALIPLLGREPARGLFPKESFVFPKMVHLTEPRVGHLGKLLFIVVSVPCGTILA